MEYLVAFLHSLLEIVAPIFAMIVGPLAVGALYKLFKRLGLDTDKLNREALQTAITNGALEAVRQAGGPGKALRIDNWHLTSGFQQAMRGAPDAIKYFGIGPEEVEKRVLAQATAIVQQTPTVDVPSSTPGGACSKHAEIDQKLARLARHP